MKIAACYKLVPINEQITVNPDRTLNFEKAEWEVGAYDRNAVEAAMTLASQSGASVTALTVGGEMLNNTKLKRKSFLLALPRCMVSNAVGHWMELPRPNS